MKTITASELKSRLESDDFNAILLDVREQDEWDEVNIPQATLVPLRTVPAYVPNLKKDDEIIVLCKIGGRSAKACQYLTGLGYENVANVTGGMDEYVKL